MKTTYDTYVENPMPSTRKKYLTWRLRIHLRCNTFMKRDLERVNSFYDLGLNDDEAGPLMWEFHQG